MRRPHVLVVPFPAQGHVTPLMELSHRLVDRGFTVTFANAQGETARLVAVLKRNGHKTGGRLRLVAIPNWVGPEEGWDGVWDEVHSVVPGRLKLLIEKINEEEEEKISCMIVDVFMVPALTVADELGLKKAAFCFTSMVASATILHIPKMIEGGIIDANGIPTKEQAFRLSPTMPEMRPNHLYWYSNPDQVEGQLMYKMILKNNKLIRLADWILCNSLNDLEPSAMDLIPRALSIGPLLSQDRRSHSQPAGHFWPEEPTCLKWLDQHPASTVVYAAFGSFAVLSREQLHEFALGLELTGGPFLWVVRPDLCMDGSAACFPDGFQERTAKRGKLVTWAPQQKVLAHPSIACFISHCGWNSTTEGLSNGVPFLCWPYFTDQFLHQSFICEIWKVGMALVQDEDGIVKREEIKRKVGSIVSHAKVKARATEYKKMVDKAISKDGDSSKNFENFIEALM